MAGESDIEINVVWAAGKGDGDLPDQLIIGAARALVDIHGIAKARARADTIIAEWVASADSHATKGLEVWEGIRAAIDALERKRS